MPEYESLPVFFQEDWSMAIELPQPPSVSPYLSVAFDGTDPYPASPLYWYVLSPHVVWFTTCLP